LVYADTVDSPTREIGASLDSGMQFRVRDKVGVMVSDGVRVSTF